MDIRLSPRSADHGRVSAVASKSAAHRALIAAALAEGTTHLVCPEKSRDIIATASSLSSLGISVTETPDGYDVGSTGSFKRNATLDCGESGTTYRFLLALVSALGVGASLVGHGRLPERPLSPLYEVLLSGGVSLSPKGSNPLTVSGALDLSEISFEGNVSSQYASGLLLSLPILARRKGSPVTLTLTGRIESLPYIDMTLSVMRDFGVTVTRDLLPSGDIRFTVPPTPYRSRKCYAVEGDYSGAAFCLAAGAIGKFPVTVMGLDPQSAQGDREILSLLQRFGADVLETEGGIRVSPAPLHGITVDCAQIPDLVPILAVVGAAAVGETHLVNAGRLRLKESDRLVTVHRMIETLGGKIKEGEDFLTVYGSGRLKGGAVYAENDHRIAMSAAVAALISDEPVTVLSAECADKSYGRFWEDARSLGLDTTIL